MISSTMKQSVVRLSMIVVCVASTGCFKGTSDSPTVPSYQGATEKSNPLSLIEVTEQSGLDVHYENGMDANEHSILQWVGGGVAIVDFDRDQQLDMFFAGGGRLSDKKVTGVENSAYQCTGEIKYTDISSLCGITGPSKYSCGCCAADYNNDGFPDLLFTGYHGLQLYQNQGDGTFIDQTLAAGLTDSLWSTSAAWADFNADGLLDIYVCHYLNWSFENHPPCGIEKPDACPPKAFDPLGDVIYFANGDGTFRVASTDCGLSPDGKGLGLVAADVDLDGDIDVYVGNDTTDNHLYLNDGTGNFQEAGGICGVSGDSLGGATGSMGIDVGDYNRDGKPDLWAANYVAESFALYKNIGKGNFIHFSNETGINAIESLYVGFGSGFIDLDCDGDLDLISSNGHVLLHPATAGHKQLPLVLLNDEGRYKRVHFDQGYFSKPWLGRGLGWADLDDDGDQDLVVTHIGDRAAVLRNEISPGESGHQHLSVHLVGRGVNRDAIGTQITLETSDGNWLGIIRGGGSYLSSNPRDVFFCVPEGVQMNQLTINWPDRSQSKHSIDRGATKMHIVQAR